MLDKKRLIALTKSVSFYNKKPDGILLFGSLTSDVNYHPGDVDLLLIFEGSNRFTHEIRVIDSVKFDLFSMPPEYAFLQVKKRSQMWLNNFSHGEVILPHESLSVLKSVSEDIINSEKPIYSEIDAKRSIYSLESKIRKIKREPKNSTYFDFLIIDFLNKLNQHLHLLEGKWPGLGPGKEKIERLFHDFGEASNLASNLIKSSSREEKIHLLGKIFTSIKGEEFKKGTLLIQDLDVSKLISIFR